jgi:hypothetical protein
MSSLSSQLGTGSAVVMGEVGGCRMPSDPNVGNIEAQALVG